VRFEDLVYGRRLQRLFARVGLPQVGSAASNAYTRFMVRGRGLARPSEPDHPKKALRGLTMLAELYQPN
jgi:hypothetical protein